MANRALTLEEVTAALEGSKTRGEYFVEVKDFFESGELARDFSLKFPSKESSTLRNSIDQNAKKIENHPPYKLVFVANGDKKHVVLINMDVYHLQAQADEA